MAMGGIVAHIMGLLVVALATWGGLVLYKVLNKAKNAVNVQANSVIPAETPQYAKEPQAGHANPNTIPKDFNFSMG